MYGDFPGLLMHVVLEVVTVETCVLYAEILVHLAVENTPAVKLVHIHCLTDLPGLHWTLINLHDL